MRMPETPWPSMNCLVLLLALSLLYGCGAVNRGSVPSTQSSSIRITPAAAQIRVSGTQQFSVMVSVRPPVVPKDCTSSPGQNRKDESQEEQTQPPHPCTGSVDPTNPGVTWSINGVPGGNLTVGTIDAQGLYRAPATLPNPNSLRVTATSMVDPTKSASANVAIVGAVAVSLSIAPTEASVPTAGTQLFTASVTGTSNTVVTWGLSGAGCSGGSCGKLSTSSLSAVYLAPSVAPTPASVNVIATSVVDPNKSASADLKIVPAVVVGVTPANVSAPVGATQQFAASVTGTSNTVVAWAVSGTGCSGRACGTISSSGLYTAPTAAPSPASVTITATSDSDPSKFATASVTILPPGGAAYYLAPAADGGNDANSGLSPVAPWLTPNHTVNCGDVLTAVPGTYSNTNFQAYDWGTVTCTAGNNVAWVKCASFDVCKISSTNGRPGVQIGKSYWGVQGFEVSTGGGNNYAACFNTYSATGATIHHIIFANNIANGCEAGGIALSNISTTVGYDYVAIVGNIAYNAAQTNLLCSAGFGFYQPIASDSLPGTHLYMAGNFSWDNVVPDPCGGFTRPYDGEGIALDTLDGSQGGLPSPYNQQIVVTNNITFLNGSWGISVEGGGNTAAPVYLTQNTVYGNQKDAHQSNAGSCGQITLETYPNKVLLTQVAKNLVMNSEATGGSCGSGDPSYLFSIYDGNGTDVIYQNFGYSAAGNNTQNTSSTGFSYGPNNTFGTNPGFASVADPGAPLCSGYANVPACMATVIANFTPENAAAIGYGYQLPSSKPVDDPLFPQWLCSVTNFPTSLVTLGC